MDEILIFLTFEILGFPPEKAEMTSLVLTVTDADTAYQWLRLRLG